MAQQFVENGSAPALLIGSERVALIQTQMQSPLADRSEMFQPNNVGYALRLIFRRPRFAQLQGFSSSLKAFGEFDKDDHRRPRRST